MIEGSLLDNSAWSRLAHPALPPARAEEVAESLEAGSLFACLPFALEAGYSTRSVQEHDALFTELRALPWAPIDERVEQLCMDAQRALARVGHHRLPPVDVLVAALAHRHGLGVLHYDGDFDVIAEKTELRYASTRLVERGTLA